MPDSRPCGSGPESGSDVARLFFYGKARLRFSPPAPLKGGGGDRSAQDPADSPCEDLRLVVAPAESAGPVEWNGDDEVHVRKVGGILQPLPKHRRETAPRAPVIIVLEGLRDFIIRGAGFIDKERRGVSVVFPWSLDAGVEAVCNGIVGEFPDMGEGQTCRAGDAEIILRGAQLAAADEAVSWKKKVPKGPEDCFYQV